MPPFDAYRALQLDPRASLDLIAESYWVLVARARRRDAQVPSQANEARVAGLNLAYEILSDEARRQVYDDEHGLAGVRAPKLRKRKRGIFELRKPPPPKLEGNYYEILCVAADAEVNVIDLGAEMALRRSVRRGDNVEQIRKQIAEAKRVLSDPALRAAYDASLARRQPVRGAGPSLKVIRSNGHAEKDEAVREVEQAVEPMLPGGEDAVESALSHDGSDGPASRVPAEFTRPMPLDDRGLEPDEMPAPGAPGQKRGLLQRLFPSSGTPVLATDGAAVLPAPLGDVHRTAPARNGSSNRAEAIEQQRERLLTLRSDSSAPAALPRKAAPAAVAPVVAELLFTAGPRAGERIAIGVDTLTLGSGEDADIFLADAEGDVEPEHARIWQHGEDVIFRQVGPGDTLVCGAPLVVPLVMLEDGDDIQIGIHRMRFALLR